MKTLVQKQLSQSITTLQTVLADTNIADTIVSIGQLTAKALQNGGKLLVAGNGGSAANAQHLAAEFVVRLTANHPELRIIALAADASALPTGDNKLDYEVDFSSQIEALGQPGDVFLGISASGNSENVIAALEQCAKQSIPTIGFSGGHGGKMRELCEYNVIIPSDVTANIQEAHLVLEHIFCMAIERFLFGMDFDKQIQNLGK